VSALPRRSLMLIAALVGGVVLAIAVATGASAIAWMVVAGTAAFASGLVVASTARVLPATVLAVLAAAALVVAVTGQEDESARSFDSVEAPARE
jgi:uncharacterized oligopeptide transporter (OPT) family protein